jgi:hypothetical protein
MPSWTGPSSSPPVDDIQGKPLHQPDAVTTAPSLATINPQP